MIGSIQLLGYAEVGSSILPGGDFLAICFLDHLKYIFITKFPIRDALVEWSKTSGLGPDLHM